jgi:hypothetical protein
MPQNSRCWSAATAPGTGSKVWGRPRRGVAETGIPSGCMMSLTGTRGSPLCCDTTAYCLQPSGLNATVRALGLKAPSGLPSPKPGASPSEYQSCSQSKYGGGRGLGYADRIKRNARLNTTRAPKQDERRQGWLVGVEDSSGGTRANRRKTEITRTGKNAV